MINSKNKLQSNSRAVPWLPQLFHTLTVRVASKVPGHHDHLQSEEAKQTNVSHDTPDQEQSQNLGVSCTSPASALRLSAQTL